MRNKKAKVRSLNRENTRGKVSSIAFALLSLVLTIVIFSGLVFAQNALTNNIVYQDVVVAKEDIPENEIITEENMRSYFTVKSVNVLDATSGYVTTIDPVLGKRAKVALLKDEIVTAKDFEDISQYEAGIEDPVEISVDIGRIANADAGKIRAGDVVNMSFMYNRTQLNMSSDSNYVSYSSGTLENSDWDEFGSDEDFDFEGDDVEDDDMEVEEELVETEPNLAMPSADSENYVFDYYSKYVLEGLYVKAVYDTAGNEIAPSDTVSSATILVFVIDKSQEAAVNNAVANCEGIRISKVLNPEVPAVAAEETEAGEEVDE